MIDCDLLDENILKNYGIILKNAIVKGKVKPYNFLAIF